MAEQEFMTPGETDRYIDERIAKAMKQPSKRSALQRVWGLVGSLLWLALILSVITVFLFVARVQYGLPIPLPSNLVSTAAVTFSTAAAPLSAARQEGQRPASAPALPVGGAAPWPTLTPEPPQPTLTIPSIPTATEGFWDPAEIAAFTATAAAWYDPATLPTAEPAFVEYATKACGDPEMVAESATLRLFCEK